MVNKTTKILIELFFSINNLLNEEILQPLCQENYITSTPQHSTLQAHTAGKAQIYVWVVGVDIYCLIRVGCIALTYVNELSM